MIHVLLCDDEPVICREIEQTLMEYGLKHQEQIEVTAFSGGEELIKHLSGDSTDDLLFLDIVLSDGDGAQIGLKIRDELHNEKLQIIYISAYEQYAMQLFQTRPFDFLLKPISRDKITAVFEKYMKIYGNHTQYFEYAVGGSREKVPLSEIYYFMCEGRKIVIVTGGGKISFYGKMKDMHDFLDARDFWSVHMSFIINVKYVKRFKENEIIMCDGRVIPISYTYKKAVKGKIRQLGE
ncbi:MAG: LytTR family DNA-binding domain-containing protein [Lachnospiraceae bacterium]|nr:LytTR family DNA-binding domain-containing protein [Lachnospiraceae bacterium]